MKNLNWSLLVLPIVSVVLGIYLILRPWSATAALCALIGWAILLAGLAGVFNAVAFQRATLSRDPLLPVSVAGAVVGLFFVARPNTLVEIVGLVVCVILMVEGITNIQNAVQRKRWGDGLWWLPLAVGIAGVALGLYTLFAPWSSTAMVMRAIGVLLAASGAVNILAAVLVRD